MKTLSPLAEYTQRRGISTGELARRAEINKGTLSKMMRGEYWPTHKGKGAQAIRRLFFAMSERTQDQDEINELFRCSELFFKTQKEAINEVNTPKTKPQVVKKPHALAQREAYIPPASIKSMINRDNNPEGITDMLLRKQTLSNEARQHFKLPRPPFTDDLGGADEVYLNPDIRYVRESMWSKVRNGGMLAVIGESGAGKSTLRMELIERLMTVDNNCIVIEPYVLAMEANDVKGKTLKADSIAEAIITAVSPLEKPKRSSEARFAQLHRLLKDSAQSGNKHLLIIEEAHCLPTPTLKHLKRFMELKLGFKGLLTIILIGQPELKMKLSERNPEVREVVGRCEIVDFAPLDNSLDDFLQFKLARVGVDASTVFATGAIDAMRQKLTFTDAHRGAGSAQRSTVVSLLYPLAVGNLANAAMNMAASLGVPQVTADIVREV